MKRIIKKTIALLLFIGLFLPTTHAQTVYTIDDVPNVYLQDRNAYVSDPEQQLAIEDIEVINTELRFFEDSLGVQCAVIVVPEIDTEPSEFAHDLFNQWSIGDKETDRGLLFLLVYGYGKGTQRDIYMATGYGLEADLPDVLCKHIQLEIMLPLLEEENFGEGLISGILETKRLLQNKEESLILAQQIEEANTRELILVFGTFGLIGLLFFFISGLVRLNILKKVKDPYKAYVKDHSNPMRFAAGCLSLIFVPIAIPYNIILKQLQKKYIYSRLHCKKCGSNKIKKPSYKKIREATKEKDGITRYYFACEDCGYVHTEDINVKYVASSSSSSSSSSGSSGGSWGGGSSGGGGAGSSF